MRFLTLILSRFPSFPSQGKRSGIRNPHASKWVTKLKQCTIFFCLLTPLLSACNSTETISDLFNPPVETPLPPTPAIEESTVTPQPTLGPEPVTADPNLLTIWVTPAFDPTGELPGAAILMDRIHSFETENPGVKIQVRIKAPNGPGGLLESLAAAKAAAPRALPSLVVLSRAEMENAALKNLIYPMDDLTQVMSDPDWYAYARQLATLQGSTFGLPWAGDALMLLFRPAKIGNAPISDWPSILSRGQPVIFPAGDPLALLTLTLYQSLGGKIVDSQGRPALQSDLLATVLKLYNDGGRQGVFPAWLTQYLTDDQAWQAYREERGPWLVSWASHYLSTLPADTSAIPLPPLGEAPYTLGTGWVWSVSEPSAEKRPMAAKLAEYLVDADFLSKYDPVAGYLPTRPSSLPGWTNQTLQTLISQVVQSTDTRPTNDLLASVGPALKDATLQVIKGQSDPIQAAQAAAEALSGTQSK
jgi:multiple sugar transport system substrate-binding protein